MPELSLQLNVSILFMAAKGVGQADRVIDAI